jgi:hypothetical protein
MNKKIPTPYEALFADRGFPVSRRVYIRDKRNLMANIPHFITHASHEKHKYGYKNGFLKEPEYEISQSDEPYSIEYAKVYKGRVRITKREFGSCYAMRSFIRKCLNSKTLRILDVE